MERQMDLRSARKPRQSRKTSSCEQALHGEQLLAALNWAIDERIFAHLTKHGNTSWIASDLVLLAILWVWSGHGRLTGAFDEARLWSLHVLGRAAVNSYQGLLKALVTWTSDLLPLVAVRLQELMRRHGGTHWRIGRWLPLAVDGSRITVPRTEDNERAFCAPNYGKSAKVKYRRRLAKWHRDQPQRPIKPQIWLTLLWHAGLQMPWSWRCGPSFASERDHLRQMLHGQKFPENTMFCGDAGFTGYDLWKDFADRGHHFLFRVGANVRLLRKLGYVREDDGIVCFWPDKIAAQKHKQPPLVLRLMCFQGERSPVYAVTNVLSARQLSQREARRLYQLRWGVELQFRHVKQTFGRGKLRSRTPARAFVELDWSLCGLWLIQLFAVKEQIAARRHPARCSVSLAIDVIRLTLARWSERPASGATLRLNLRSAVKDEYHRTSSKQARYHPNYKEIPAAGKPTVISATKRLKAFAARLLAAA
jgi:hypothetical protein